jgi:hypothetical protein
MNEENEKLKERTRKKEIKKERKGMRQNKQIKLSP